MKWPYFQRKIKDKSIAIFGPLEVQRLLGVSKTAARFLLRRYTQAGLIIQLRKGLYILADTVLPDIYLANKLYEPSYVSLEFALSYHGIIPETVYEITSITTRPTKQYDLAKLGKIFSYQYINRKFFWGYIPVRRGNFTALIAEPEKAYLDLIYFAILKKTVFRGRINKTKLNKDKVLKYAKAFNNERLFKIIKNSLK